VTIVCLGEALVDLIGEPAGGEPERFGVHFGGALANVAVAAARSGAPAALFGGVGDDHFGRLLRRGLAAEGVDVAGLQTLPGTATAFAFVRVDGAGDPSFELHGAGIEAGVGALAGGERELLIGASALVVGSNTLTGGAALGVTRAAVAEAGQAGVPVLFDPNLRPGRWRRLEAALERCRELAAEVTVIKANLLEARRLVGAPEAGQAEAAERLLELGPALAVVTSGPSGATARLAGRAAACSEPAPAVTRPRPLGAGDAFMGALAGGLHARDWDLDRVAEVLGDAVRAGSEACTRAGAIA